MSMTDQEIAKWREGGYNKLKDAIKRAKAEGIHVSFVKLLEAYDQLNIKDKVPMILHDGATEEQIVEFEKTFDIAIPASYREFLKFTNGADLREAAVEFFGVDKHEKKNYTLYNTNDTGSVDNTSKAVPKDLLIIGEDIANDLICININTGEIVGWDYRDIGDEEYSLNTDFYTYLEEDLVDYMNDKEDGNG